ncbi:GDSL-type esterase/lipase family protein [Parapedobacter deserti]|uniref:GDSL-type esterase/lipase family protein n=1 Tax=Parapedobacter deserti TaxID=1912957 RepID=A0ABV7JFQ9_9SPHI
MNKLLRLSLLLCLLSLAWRGSAQEVPELHRNRIEQLRPSIAAFKAEDAKNGITQGAILMVGSSSFTRWQDADKAFPSHRIINRGFGGSQLYDILYFFDQVVMPYKPCQILLYEGDNDIASGMTPEQYLEDVITFVRLVEVRLPGTVVSIVSTKPSPARAKWESAYLRANRLVRELTETKPHVQYIDVAQLLYNRNGKLRPELFIQDQIHLNEKGYAIWQAIIAPYLIDEGLKNKK